MIIREILALIAFVIGTAFGIAGMVGLFRFKDPYSRLHAGSLCGTTAVFSYLLALLMLSPSLASTARLVILIVFFLISAPTGSSIVARFIWESGDAEQHRSSMAKKDKSL
ncbi:MAG: monovalent cation/H(+) antiporter subunit G [Sphaerochaeta sp.]|jgi:multicomponent Na+:H+ antiporter subunit G|uniref:cation:proton antiporter n=1 Tax=unclassified Sphaerochaeta TaxID=2637943 RepID=UPI000E8708DE|nr:MULTISPECIES: monovalent cation/H(+) antiporter subunit G [unclassified Sphaerochaeta]MCK9600514.1 monovalent cation/H(+) antiporter subunit G [Sphaerochaeta sp.]MDX9823486.1 monovalent cation/H(+) antiporter subunit G [Sphaerochaeta sp.]MEA4864432.1 monovalent cation/H(+) antiporter subunit G [Sphaerochaeta sp.]HAP56639.1 cation:proton antiporter [Sphaerochaeta sp.]HBO35585.1 cation:proton antiporter [Sphaerochaeta sp.]